MAWTLYFLKYKVRGKTRGLGFLFQTMIELSVLLRNKKLGGKTQKVLTFCFAKKLIVRGKNIGKYSGLDLPSNIFWK